MSRIPLSIENFTRILNKDGKVNLISDAATGQIVVFKDEKNPNMFIMQTSPTAKPSIYDSLKLSAILNTLRDKHNFKILLPPPTFNILQGLPAALRGTILGGLTRGERTNVAITRVQAGKEEKKFRDRCRPINCSHSIGANRLQEAGYKSVDDWEREDPDVNNSDNYCQSYCEDSFKNDYNTNTNTTFKETCAENPVYLRSPSTRSSLLRGERFEKITVLASVLSDTQCKEDKTYSTPNLALQLTVVDHRKMENSGDLMTELKNVENIIEKTKTTENVILISRLKRFMTWLLVYVINNQDVKSEYTPKSGDEDYQDPEWNITIRGDLLWPAVYSLIHIFSAKNLAEEWKRKTFLTCSSIIQEKLLDMFHQVTMKPNLIPRWEWEFPLVHGLSSKLIITAPRSMWRGELFPPFDTPEARAHYEWERSIDANWNIVLVISPVFLPTQIWNSRLPILFSDINPILTSEYILKSPIFNALEVATHQYRTPWYPGSMDTINKFSIRNLESQIQYDPINNNIIIPIVKSLRYENIANALCPLIYYATQTELKTIYPRPSRDFQDERFQSQLHDIPLKTPLVLDNPSSWNEGQKLRDLGTRYNEDLSKIIGSDYHSLRSEYQRPHWSNISA